jgi:hypothetical protein
MNYIMTRTGQNSAYVKADNGVNVRMNFSSVDNTEVEGIVTNNLLLSYEKRIKKESHIHDK